MRCNYVARITQLGLGLMYVALRSVLGFKVKFQRDYFQHADTWSQFRYIS